VSDLIERRLDRLAREVRWLRLYAIVLTIVLIAGTYRLSLNIDSGVIHVRGIVVDDAAGRARILIGAPIPAAANRVRTDSTRARRIWGPHFPAEYMTYYRTYRHSMTGILIMNDSGFDRVAIGDSTPDPNVGRRIGPATGIQVNDAHGFERGGFGLLTVGGKDRAVLGLDSRHGEAVSLSTIDSGASGLRMFSGDRSLFVGGAPAEDSVGGRGESFFGAIAYRGDDVTYRVDALTKRWRLAVSD
jgi:hypothetical protein